MKKLKELLSKLKQSVLAAYASLLDFLGTRAPEPESLNTFSEHPLDCDCGEDNLDVDPWAYIYKTPLRQLGLPDPVEHAPLLSNKPKPRKKASKKKLTKKKPAKKKK